MNAIDLLKADHAKVQGLFRQYENAGERQREIAEQIFTELEMHAMLEEELFYPALAGHVGSVPATEETEAEEEGSEGEEEDPIAEALEEHREVKTLIATLRTLDPGDEPFQTKFAELRESVEEHVGMEEDELMPEAVAALGGELERLGRRLEERKEQLMAGKS
jgi:iron-sulfur cluster repair protein YtfE (RIC family)